MGGAGAQYPTLCAVLFTLLVNSDFLRSTLLLLVIFILEKGLVKIQI